MKASVRFAGVVVAGAVALSGCRANPGPPPLASPDDTSDFGAPSSAAASSTTPVADEPADAPVRTQVSVGVDPLTSGLNPHMLANNSQLVYDLAELALPSAFHDGVMDTDLLTSAEEIPAPPGVAQRVRYTIASAAQWSDGSPISANDFIYLWEGMATTPGVTQPAPYRAISAISGSAGGRVVTVDFSQRVDNWQVLFTHLIPSHLVSGTDFGDALADAVPASAGRFLIASVDRARGIITLHRNDRFWGANPARVDIVRLRSVRSTSQAANMLRSGQIGFADVRPDQTLEEALGLLPGVSTAEVGAPRQLRLQIALEDREARRELAGNLDVAQVARLATGRTTSLNVPYGGTRNPTDETAALKALTHPVRIGVDPTDATALNAATIIVDQLAARGVWAEVVRERMAVITGELLPVGKVDAVLTWVDSAPTAANLANAYLCVDEPTVVPTSAAAGAQNGAEQAGEEKAASASVDVQGTSTSPADVESETHVEPAPWAGDLSGFCPAGAAETRADILSGRVSPGDALAAVRALNNEENLYVPLLDETRIHALGRGIVGPGSTVKDWDAGVRTAATWEMGGEE